jgi:hypothetical protein
VGVVADKLWSAFRWTDERMMRAYQAEDAIFRMALYMRRRSLGESPKMAALAAREQFLDYDIRAPWVVALRNTGLPFISFTYRAVPLIAHNIQLRPWKVAKYAALGYGLNAMSYLLDDWDDDTEEKDKRGEVAERAALRDEQQGTTWLGVPRMVRMPWRDSHGLPVFLDVRRWIPAGDIFDSTQGSSALPMPGSLQFGGPLVMAGEFLLNKQAFNGEEITNELTDTGPEKVKKVAGWAWRSWTTPALYNPGSYYWNKVWDAMHGATDATGRPYTVPQAVASSFGIKVGPVDPDTGIMWHIKEFKQVRQELDHQVWVLANQLHRGLISQSAFDKGVATLTEKFMTLGQNANELSAKSRKPEKVE